MITFFYFGILNVLLLITSYLSLKIVKNTIGKNIKEQFNKKLFCKVFLMAFLSYLLSIILMIFIAYLTTYNSHFSCDIDSFLLIFILLIFTISEQPYVEGVAYTDHILLDLSILVLLTFFANIMFSYFVVFQNLNLKKSKRFCAALIVSAMTAPYFYFVPFGGF